MLQMRPFFRTHATSTDTAQECAGTRVVRDVILFSPDCFCSQAHHEWRGANFLRDVGDVAKLLRYA